MARDLSIIICTYDRRELLFLTLQAIQDRGYFDKFEIIVVENTDVFEKRQETVTSCNVHFPMTKILESQTAGLSRARNLGLRAATSPIVAYLDDDAIPDNGWAEALLEAFSNENVVYAGGPIRPRWEAPPPEWIPPELYGAFTVLDLGSEDHIMTKAEFAYGANMAFRTHALNEIDGFDEELGRKKNNLHGEEDIAVQKKLQAYGVGFYKVAASVSHFVPASRTSWHWLVRRFAWQGVSEISQSGSLQDFHKSALKHVEIEPLLARLYVGFMMVPRTQAEARHRLEFIRAFTGGLLYARPQDTLLDLPKVTRKESRDISTVNIRRVSWQSDRQIVAVDGPVFIEFGQSHAYLFDAYGDIPGSRLINSPVDAWSDSEAAAASLFSLSRLLQTQMWSPLFLTIDWVLFSLTAQKQFKFIKSTAIIHRTYEEHSRIAALRVLSESVRLASYSPATAEWVSHVTSMNCAVMRHPPLMFKNVKPQKSIRWRMDKLASRTNRLLNVALVGEMRPGKGFEFVAECLCSSTFLRNRIKLQFAGGASSTEKVESLRKRMRQGGVHCDVDLGVRSKSDHRGIPGSKFARIIEEADVVLFPYHSAESKAMSGHLVDAVFAGCRILVSRESVMREWVESWALGGSFSVGDFGSLERALEAEMSREGYSHSEDSLLEQFCNEYSITKVNSQLCEFMRD